MSELGIEIPRPHSQPLLSISLSLLSQYLDMAAAKNYGYLQRLS